MMAAENQSWCIPYFQWLREQTFPVYMQEKNDYVPQAIVFPFKKLMNEFGPSKSKGLANWFTSSVAWMIGHAIIQMREGDEIAIFGVDMAAAEEHYTAQKGGIQRMLEYAREAGIDVKIPYESCLAKTYPLYGYSEATPMGRKLNVRLDEMTRIRAQIDQQCKQAELQRAFFDGALEGVKYDLRTWTDGMDADLNTGEKEENSDFANNALRASERAAGVTSADFRQNDAGVFVPPLPDGGSVGAGVKSDAGTKHYAMMAEPVKLSSGHTPAPSRGKSPNGRLPAG
jgi:hypothetical protein